MPASPMKSGMATFGGNPGEPTNGTAILSGCGCCGAGGGFCAMPTAVRVAANANAVRNFISSPDVIEDQVHAERGVRILARKRWQLLGCDKRALGDQVEKLAA